MGRPGSPRPVRLRRMAAATAWTALSWPTTSDARRLSSRARRSRSASPTRWAGMPLARATTWAMSSRVRAGEVRPSRSARIRAAADASSIRSMALSGRLRPGRYRTDSSTASSRASGVIITPWYRSYRGASPARMSRAWAGVGSSICTRPNRRSRAGSFWIWVRNSWLVVAPIICSSPRASTGFKILAASMAPSAAPAPTMVWNSSTNKMTPPSRTSSSSRPFSRSSKSPRYLVPATRLAISNASSRRPFRARGTCPAAIRWARPSARAVLPTPGSPTRQGLFFWRRHKISIIRSSSLSRQNTGSSSPSAARRVRSRQYLSLARLPRGTPAEARGWMGRVNCPDIWRHSRTASASCIPMEASSTPARQPPSSRMAQSRCSGSAFSWRALRASINA